jgi:hypothetical protein
VPFARHPNHRPGSFGLTQFGREPQSEPAAVAERLTRCVLDRDGQSIWIGFGFTTAESEAAGTAATGGEKAGRKVGRLSQADFAPSIMGG